LSIAFIAILITERYVAGRNQNSLVTGLPRHRAEVSPATLTKEVRGLGHVWPGVRRPTPGTHVQAVDQQALAINSACPKPDAARQPEEIGDFTQSI
jgi:hypothetical protein